MVEMRKTREGWGKGLVEIGERNKDVVVLVGDLSNSTMVNFFAEKFPERFFDIGIAEQNMTNIAAGLSLTGKIPYYSTYGAFAALRGADQLRVTVAYSNLNIKIGGAHGGISVGPDGATHQMLEDISVIRSIPNMQLIVPCDFWETKKATVAAADVWGPVYIRFGRENVPVVTDEDTPFEFGKGYILRDGSDVAIIACGVMVYEAMCAAEDLQKQRISARVINIHTIKPIDKDIILQGAKETGAIVTAEEHQIYGGFGSAVAEVVAENNPVPMKFVGIKDTFGTSGKPEELMEKFGLTAKNIVSSVKEVLKLKNRH